MNRRVLVERSKIGPRVHVEAHTLCQDPVWILRDHVQTLSQDVSWNEGEVVAIAIC
jgi:hypothetical protein